MTPGFTAELSLRQSDIHHSTTKNVPANLGPSGVLPQLAPGPGGDDPCGHCLTTYFTCITGCGTRSKKGDKITREQVQNCLQGCSEVLTSCKLTCGGLKGFNLA